MLELLRVLDQSCAPASGAILEAMGTSPGIGNSLLRGPCEVMFNSGKLGATCGGAEVKESNGAFVLERLALGGA